MATAHNKGHVHVDAHYRKKASKKKILLYGGIALVGILAVVLVARK